MTTDPQTAADAAERVQAFLDARAPFAVSDVIATVIPNAGRRSERFPLTASDLTTLLADRARLAAELEQVRKDHRRQLGSAVFWRRRAFQLADLIPAAQIPDPEWDDSDESQLAERNEELRDAVTEAARLLARLSGPGPCDVDPDGACRGHAGFASGYLEPCPHPLGRRFVEAWGAGQSPTGEKGPQSHAETPAPSPHPTPEGRSAHRGS